jgi:hypothetical protein
MPRRHRRDPAFSEPPDRPLQRWDAPLWASLPGFEVREVGGDKPYRCPGCDHQIRAGVRHLVVVPQDDPDSRRHWHTECWRSEMRRLGRHRA